MPFTIPDPTLEPEPDFNDKAFGASQQILLKGGILEGAVNNTIQEIWINNREAQHVNWECNCDKYLRQEQEHLNQPPQVPPAPLDTNPAPPPAPIPPIINQALHPPPPPLEIAKDKKTPKVGAFPHGVPVATESALYPSDYTKQKLIKGEWVELWYFTKNGCLEAV
ncbi:hypothetical protein APHAL10511_003436 [Amanita phalloides]|nr:hypothetical protein APHAL10511_003436 [Amanita phalloides]